MLFFIPQIIKSIGVTSNTAVGWLTMVPYICGGVGLILWGAISDRMNERRWNLLIARIVSTLGLVIAGLTMGTWSALGHVDCGRGLCGAVVIAWINSIGNLGGFFALGALAS